MMIKRKYQFTAFFLFFVFLFLLVGYAPLLNIIQKWHKEKIVFSNFEKEEHAKKTVLTLQKMGNKWIMSNLKTKKSIAVSVQKINEDELSVNGEWLDIIENKNGVLKVIADQIDSKIAATLNNINDQIAGNQSGGIPEKIIKIKSFLIEAILSVNKKNVPIISCFQNKTPFSNLNFNIHKGYLLLLLMPPENLS